ncbi:MAG: exonuclease domain-containing protein [Bacteroides sp.]|jgi:DNA polymerase-3 subunit epsilon|nr:exonuclease domain-containing protein [Bacteroides sp.]
MYAIIDIETTGGNPYRDKITEIAVFIHDGKQVVREYNTLINPERRIPPFITRMTGITDEMVARAPRFFEIAKEIVQLTQNTVFVAHNASFDYNFVRNEFKTLGYDFNRNHVCTVKLSRKLLPGKTSYSLGRLCQELGISINNRHRAAGDALATVKLFERLLKEHPEGFLNGFPGPFSPRQAMNPSLSEEHLEALPPRTGVYYFFNEKDEIIYIGKSKSIRQRVMSHFSSLKSQKALKMAGQVMRVDYEETGSELAALLLESEEIKRHQPLFNRRQRRNFFNYGLYSFTDPEGYLNLKVEKTSSSQTPHTSFANKEMGRDFLFKLVEKYNLCQNLSGLFPTSGACFQYAVKQCRGACLGIEPPQSYNQRVREALENASMPSQNMIIVDKGRRHGEKYLIMIEGGRFSAAGYAVPEEVQAMTPANLEMILQPATDNRDARLIISGFVRNKRVEKLIPF